MNFLQSTHAGQLVADKTELVTARLSDTVEAVLGKMFLHNILSVPLVNDSGQFVGIISLQDIVLDMVWRPEERTHTAANLTRQVRDVFALREEAKRLWIVNDTESLSSIIDTFSNGVHRALVPQKDDLTKHMHYVMLSQSDVVNYLQKHSDQFKEIVAKTLVQLRLSEKKIDTITADRRAFDCFKLLGDEYVTCLPIVEKETGRLLANFSASDLRGLTVPKLKFMNESVETFLQAQTGGIRPPVVVKPTGTLADVMKLIVDNKVHRVWVVDDKDRPVSIVTLTDILSCFKGAK